MRTGALTHVTSVAFLLDSVAICFGGSPTQKIGIRKGTYDRTQKGPQKARLSDVSLTPKDLLHIVRIALHCICSVMYKIALQLATNDVHSTKIALNLHD